MACGPIPVRPAPIPNALPLPPAVTSCAVQSPRQQVVDVREVAWVGRAGDRTWVLAKSGAHRVLLRLVDDKVEPFVLPEAFSTGFVSAHAQEHFIWVLRTGEGKPMSGPAWVLVDVRDPEKPKVGRIELLAPVPADAPNRFAVWNERALFFLGSPGKLSLWNLDKRIPVGGQIKPDTKATDVPWLHCSASHCLSIFAEGHEDKRHITLRRIDTHGKETAEEIGPGTVGEVVTFRWKDHIYAAWSRFDDKGLWARQIDAQAGTFNGAVYTISGVEADIQDPVAIQSRQGPFLAWQAARVGWRMGKLDEDGITVNEVISLPAKGSFLSGTSTDDGIIAAVYSSGQDEERGGKEWYASVRALFVPFGKTPAEGDVVTLINEERGHGQGGFSAYALAAPNAAAVLATPVGSALGDPIVMLLRKPCSDK